MKIHCIFGFLYLVSNTEWSLSQGPVKTTPRPVVTTKAPFPPITGKPGPGNGPKDIINGIPGLNFRYTAKQYAGYLASGGNTKFFYWYLESHDVPAKDPLIVWLSPYPGCSSLAGLLMEVGPFRPNPDANSLHENVFAWTKAANLLFIDSPAGAGFSPTGKGKMNDEQVATSNFQALYDFFYTKFPALQTKDLYIAGQGYGAVFALTLAKKVADAVAKKQFPNILKGIILGNGAVSERYQFNAMISMMYSHGLIGNEVWDQVRSSCACRDGPPEQCGFYGAYNTTATTDCKKSLTSLLQSVSSNMSLDITNIHRDCYSATPAKRMKRAAITNPPGYFPFSAKVPQPSVEAKTAPRSAYDIAVSIDYDTTDSLLGFSCWADIARYLSSRPVMQEVHVDKAVKSFTTCRNIDYIQTEHTLDEVMVYLLKINTIRFLLYNGDLDLEYNFMGQEWFIERHLALGTNANLKVVEKRTPWTYRGQTAGFVKRYTNLDYIVVKGAGRTVSMDRGGPALQMLVNFLKHSNSYSAATSIKTVPSNGGTRAVKWFMTAWGFILLFTACLMTRP